MHKLEQFSCYQNFDKRKKEDLFKGWRVKYIYKSEVSQNFDTNLVNKGAQVLEDFFLFHISAIPFNEHIKKYYIQH